MIVINGIAIGCNDLASAIAFRLTARILGKGLRIGILSSYIAVVRDISVAVVPLHMKEILNTFAEVVPVVNVPVVLKLVENVSTKLLVPLVVTIRLAFFPAEQFVALIVSVCAGVSV